MKGLTSSATPVESTWPNCRVFIEVVLAYEQFKRKQCLKIELD
jgi:hypothetical protein